MSLYAINCKHTDRKTWPSENVNSRRIEHAVMDCPQCKWYVICSMSIQINKKKSNHWFVAFESIKYSVSKIHWNCNIVGLLHHPFWLYLDFGNFWHHFSYFKLLCLAKDHWRGFNTLNAHMVHIKFNPI